MRCRCFLTAVLLLLCLTAVRAQDSLATQIAYDLTAEAAVGTGDYTAYQLVTNRHHVLSTRSNTAYMRGAVHVSHAFTPDLVLSGAVDVVGSVHADHKVYLQQCYANLSYQSFFLEIGAREEQPVVRHEQLSIGSFVRGSNAKPFVMAHVGTNGFWSVPLTQDWLQVNADFGYGKFLDSDYREETFRKAPALNPGYNHDIYCHKKHVYLRTNPEKRFFAIASLEHIAQFGGTRYAVDETGTLVVTKKPTDLKTLFDVVFNGGDKNYFEHNAPEDWIYGNHIGMMTYQLGWNIDRQHRLQAYHDNPFDDGSGVRKGNGWDGTWGLQYDNRSEGRQYVRSVVAEYFQSTNQSGPLHWDSGDYPEPVRSQITDFVVGNDNYYNHGFYDSYTHYGMTPGIALITSPIYNKDGFALFRDNRIKAWHLGVNGELNDHLSYLAKGSYREGWGTYDMPLPKKHYSFDAVIQGIYTSGPWQLSAAYAFDKGNVYGDCSTFNIKIGYHGKIL